VLYLHSETSECAAQRRSGFEELCRAHGIDPARLVLTLPPERPGGLSQISLVRERLRHGTVAVAGDDFLAIELMLLCERLGRTPGRDVAILGQGNESVASRIRPGLSSIDPGGLEIGRRMMETAIQRLDRSRMDAPQTVLVAPTLMERESTRMLHTLKPQRV
jgi:DNA-binding LacI/PurR family transcriptional regulator